MGTRSNTIVIDANKPLMNLYRQMDGYPSGHGAELAAFLTNLKMVNGIGGGKCRIANGAGCLAAQIVAHFKDGPGGFYIAPIDQRDNDYTYLISCSTMDPDHGILVTVLTWEEMVFSGTVQEFVTFCNAKPSK